MKEKKQKGKVSKKTKKSFWSKRNIFLILFLAAAIISIYFKFLKKPSEPQFVKGGEVTFLKKQGRQFIKSIDAEIANNGPKRMQGLMYRSHMDEDNGMLFIFEGPNHESFWMKNTIIPLDIMFIDSAGVIDTIYRKTTPYSEKSLPSRRRVQFVVEVNGGWSDKNGIKESDLIEFKVDK